MREPKSNIMKRIAARCPLHRIQSKAIDVEINREWNLLSIPIRKKTKQKWLQQRTIFRRRFVATEALIFVCVLQPHDSFYRSHRHTIISHPRSVGLESNLTSWCKG